MLMQKVVIARDSKLDYAPATGLTPKWIHLTDADSRDQVDDKPEFHELGGGQYLFSREVRPGQLFFGVVDLGPSLASGNDRYIDIYLEHPEQGRGNEP